VIGPKPVAQIVQHISRVGGAARGIHTAAVSGFYRRDEAVIGECHDAGTCAVGRDREDSEIVGHHAKVDREPVWPLYVTATVPTPVGGVRRQQRSYLAERGVIHERLHVVPFTVTARKFHSGSCSETLWIDRYDAGPRLIPFITKSRPVRFRSAGPMSMKVAALDTDPTTGPVATGMFRCSGKAADAQCERASTGGDRGGNW